MTLEIREGHALDLLRAMPADSVQCVVTSPPYYGLRSFGTEPQVWGGDPECPHEWADAQARRQGGGGDNKGNQGSFTDPGACGACGAWRGELGAEPTPQLYVEHMVSVFREVRRVLRPNGVLWLNMGDTYATGGGKVGECPSGGAQPNQMQIPGLKPKDRCMIPARVALALQADGWWLRDEIVWHKPAPMPTSVTDRTTPAHEMLYLMTKRERYYYDNRAIAEPSVSDHDSGNGYARPEQVARGGRGQATGWTVGSGGGMRNKRSVWTIPPQPFRGAHFAVMPEALVEPCILAGTSAKGNCSACGAPWERDVRRTFAPQADVSIEKGRRGAGNQKPMDASNGWEGVPRGTTKTETLGWFPSCSCDAPTTPALVLDPFAGSGTVGVVALRHGRRFLGLELNSAYAKMARERIGGPLFTVAP